MVAALRENLSKSISPRHSQRKNVWVAESRAVPAQAKCLGFGQARLVLWTYSCGSGLLERQQQKKCKKNRKKKLTKGIQRSYCFAKFRLIHNIFSLQKHWKNNIRKEIKCAMRLSRERREALQLRGCRERRSMEHLQAPLVLGSKKGFQKAFGKCKDGKMNWKILKSALFMQSGCFFSPCFYVLYSHFLNTYSL